MVVNVSEIDDKISIKSSDLINDDLELFILKLISKIMTNFSYENTNETDIAKEIKLKLDSYTQENRTKGYWCVVVGRNFGSYMSYEKGYFIHLCYSNVSFQIFKMA